MKHKITERSLKYYALLGTSGEVSQRHPLRKSESGNAYFVSGVCSFGSVFGEDPAPRATIQFLTCRGLSSPLCGVTQKQRFGKRELFYFSSQFLGDVSLFYHLAFVRLTARGTQTEFYFYSTVFPVKLQGNNG